ncbi:chromosome segregation protein SMC [Alkalibacterium kapii]|uniref:Chromosome partition protein Smc n=1 Tax=Alkalibacterium kapii TaxID=426704 RepID=A0A511ASM5_9LACT|nr:chromosome segregation protein SMC [Alkalibacterium kapii]GEK91209.1 chromosome partition protein Smc [Alkalibacterium kapii]
MQLKRLEIKGFKSFADKTVIDFTDGITAVVGPNGSGKSNIIEAIRWVMGEQSAKTLRGGRMHDVIFSGTDSRKAINIAQVTLILDNSDNFLPIDFEEVSIGRRINRNGDSDYFINKESCRLKDIIDLFMDSGLGKESFSIISQGQVEAIFNSKAEDRRAIFEEAAGVFKYKIEKEKAERKLFETQDNLDRVQDILYELKDQLEPLKKQKDIAQSYLSQKEELTDLDIALSVLKIDQYVLEQKENKGKINRLDHDLKELEVRIGQESGELKKKRSELDVIEEKREAIQEKMLTSVQQTERTEAQLRLVEEKERHQDAFLSEKENSLKKEQIRLATLNDDYDTLKVAYEKQSAQAEKLKKERDRFTSQLERLMGNKDEAIEGLRSEYMDAMQLKTSLKNEEMYLEREHQQAQINTKKYRKALDKVDQNLDEKRVEHQENDKALTEIKSEIDDLLKTYTSKKDVLEQTQELYKEKTGRLNQLNHDLQRAQAKQSSLKEMQENYAGYFAGVKAIMRSKDKQEGIVGTVADMMDVPSEVTEAIDVVLGAASQFVIVEDEKAGRSAIAYLKNKKAGRATFLPLTTIKKRFISPGKLQNVKAMDGFIGVASELIHYDDKVKNVMENLLGQTIVARDLQSANAIAKALSYTVRIVSLDGDVMNAGGSMTGGGGKRSSNAHLFSQKKEQKVLRIEIDELEQRYSLREKEMQTLQNKIDGISRELEKLRTAGEEKRLAERQLEQIVDGLTETLRRLEREAKGLQFELEEAEREETEVTANLKDVKENRKLSETELERLKHELDQLTNEKEDKQVQKERLERERDVVSEQWNKERETLASTRSKVEGIKSQIKEAKVSLSNIKAELTQLQEGGQLESKEDLHEKLELLKLESEQLKVQENALKTKHSALDERVRSLDESVTYAIQRKSELTDQKNKLDIALSRSDVSMDHLLEYLSEEYAVSYEEAKANQPENIDPGDTKKRVKLLKRGIEELGPVNIGAIEEYERVSERHDFLAAQQTDLLEAKEKLYDTMDQMDKEVKRRFFETFSQVKEQFALVFPRMFGGGKAELRLTDPDDLLHSGIEIIAQPPGKRLQSLSLLSGGERALTALSLLFAIIQVKPIPFCILDEAEAALDEANVTRFGRYLHEFASDTQFIVITHRKGTMEEADSLYGVTMHEKGVSQLVSVHLKDAIETVT